MTSAAVLALSFASTAFAGGMAEPAMTVAPAAPVAMAPAPVSADWSGFYLGAQYGLGQTKLDDGVGHETWAVRNYGVHAGYLRDLGQFVLGGELDYNQVDWRGDDKTDINYNDYTVRAKLIAGYDAGRFLPYATVGFSHLNIEYGDGTFDTLNGYVYGVGLACQATSHLRVGAELRQDSFKDMFNRSGLDYDIQSASLKVSYTF